ncbi:MAG TPA: hypothetical protein VF532_22145 [Candidatus Angelobacter sp.]
MSNILKLQTLTPKCSFGEQSNMFGSAISTVCPFTGGGAANDPFEME